MTAGEIDRLRRRVHRERAARLEAEAIAERSTRELFERQQELILLESVAAAANGADTVEQALRLVLTKMCEHLGWSVGLAWVASPDQRSLTFAPAGYLADEVRTADFVAASAAYTFSSGEGLPGRVLGSGQPAWIEDVTADTNFPRATLAAKAGLHGALGFPVLAHGQVVAVLECFSDSAQVPRPALLRVLAQVGEHLARVHERDLTQRRLRHDATHDPLTGLPNRALFADRVESALAYSRRTTSAVAVALIDLDRFKEVNDTLGHVQGDHLLIEVGARLAATLRESDTIARLGGDEFGLVLPEVGDARSAAVTARRLQDALKAPIAVDGVQVQVDASIGIAIHPLHGADTDTLMRRADVAMYEAKRTHSGHWLYSPAMDPYNPVRLGMVAALRRALDRAELVVHYQPKVAVGGSGRLCGVEALLRWPTGDAGFIPPSEFIPLAEHTGLIRPLTTYVLREALAQARRWRETGLEVPVAVNVATRSLLDVGFPDEVADLLRGAGVPARLLELEVTESTMLEDPETSMRVLDRLAALGVAISIDDFGTGYSSMAQLKRLPVRHLKIDRSFVSAMLADERDAFIVRSTIQLGHDLGLGVIAEGVEDEATLDLLEDLGCDTAQGYLIQRPAPAEQLTGWLISAARDEPVLGLPVLQAAPVT